MALQQANLFNIEKSGWWGGEVVVFFFHFSETNAIVFPQISLYLESRPKGMNADISKSFHTCLLYFTGLIHIIC